MNKNKGFTLIELMITVAIMSTLLAVGLPSFQSIIAGSRLTAAANSMVSALQLARFEAIKQHKSVAVFKKTTWEKGWDVFVDTNDNNVQNIPAEPTFATFDALNSTITAPYGTGKGTYQNFVSYDASGRAKGGHFIFCSSSDFRSVVISATGRVRVETASNSTTTYATSGC